MNNTSPTPGKSKNQSGLKTMVHSLVRNLESFHDELSVVLNDMKQLTCQIDNVSTKIENIYGQDQENVLQRNNVQQLGHSHGHDRGDVLETNKELQGSAEHHYVNIDLIPKIQNIEDKINSKLCSIELQSKEIKHYIETKEPTYKVVRPNSFNSCLRDVKFEEKTTTLYSEKSDHVIDSLESPMLDLSYLGIKQTDGRPRWSRSISVPNTDMTNYQWSTEDDLKNENCTLESAEKVTPTVFCFAELKKPTSQNCFQDMRNDVFDKTMLPITGTQDLCNDVFDKTVSPITETHGMCDDVFDKTVSPITGTTVKSFTSSSMISNISIDGDVYERQLDGDLEHMLENSDESLLVESSDENMETSSNSQTEAHSDTLDCNTWTLFTLNQMTDSTKSSDSFVSDTPSDIINDNIWPPANLVDIFSNSMLANKLNKHNDHNFFSNCQDYKD